MTTTNLEKLKLLKEVSRPGFTFGIVRFPQTNRLFIAGSDFSVGEIDITQAKPEYKEIGRHGSYVTTLALAGNMLISGGYDGQLMWWNIDQRSGIRIVDAHTKWIRQIRVSPDGQIVASVADDMVCRLWEVGTGKLIRQLKGHREKTPQHFPSMLYAVAFTPDGKHLATADKVGQVLLWETDTGKQVGQVEAPVMYTWDPIQRRHSIGGIRSLAFSPDGRWLAVGGMGKVGNIDHLEGKARVEVFDWRAGKRTHEFPGDKFNGLVERLVFQPQQQWLLAAGGANDGFLMFFDLPGNKVLRQEKVNMHVHDVATNETCDTLFLAGVGRLQQWELKA